MGPKAKSWMSSFDHFYLQSLLPCFLWGEVIYSHNEWDLLSHLTFLEAQKITKFFINPSSEKLYFVNATFTEHFHVIQSFLILKVMKISAVVILSWGTSGGLFISVATIEPSTALSSAWMTYSPKRYTVEQGLGDQDGWSWEVLWNCFTRSWENGGSPKTG